MANLPYVVSGTVTDSVGANPSGVKVVARNDRTIENTSVNTNASGEYVIDISNLTSGWNVGDQITIIVRDGLEEGESSFTISSDEASQTVNITMSEILDSTDIAYCTISEVLDELGDKTTSDISSERVRNAILKSEGYIDVRTGTSFKSNTITDEFYNTSDENMWISPESKGGFGAGTLSRADSAVSGALDTIKLKHRPILTITSLSRNIAASNAADSFDALTEQTGSGGDYIADKPRGLIAFLQDKPYFGKKRAFKISYTWGLDRTSTNRDDIVKRETVRELCILLAVRSILTSKATSSQFDSIDSISLESISISKNVSQTTAYLDQQKIRIDELFKELGVTSTSIGME